MWFKGNKKQKWDRWSRIIKKMTSHQEMPSLELINAHPHIVSLIYP